MSESHLSQSSSANQQSNPLTKRSTHVLGKFANTGWLIGYVFITLVFIFTDWKFALMAAIFYVLAYVAVFVVPLNRIISASSYGYCTVRTGARTIFGTESSRGI